MKKDNSLILNKIKSHYGFKSDAEFARFLGIAPTTLSSWHARNTIDYDLVYAKCNDVDGNWLITGKGEMLRNPENQTAPVPSAGTDQSPKVNDERTIIALQKTIAAQEKTIEALERVIASNAPKKDVL